MRAAFLLAVALSVGAPFQCASDPDPERALEDSAPRALWDLSERFRAQGNTEARRETLEHLVERYPSSRYARRAEQALATASGPPDPPHDAEDPGP